MKTISTLILIIFPILYFICNTLSAKDDFPVLKGPYLGQRPTGKTPEIFAVGIITTRYHEHSFPAFSPDLKQVLWNTVFIGNTYKFPSRILIMKNDGSKWSKPEYVDFSLMPNPGGPCFSSDGEKIYFASDFSETEQKGDLNIWYVKKNNNGWSKPEKINSPVNTKKNECQPTVTRDLTLYFMGYYEGRKYKSGIYRSEYKDGKYQTPQILPKQVNSNTIDWTPFIAPDESYILFSSLRPGGYGRGDIYISYRTGKNEWSDAVNLGPEINEKYNERFPGVSPDGKYLFYVSDKVDNILEEKSEFGYEELKKIYNSPGNGYCDIYWVSAKIIEELKPEKLK